MEKKKVCVSFDYENDRRYYNLLEAWNDNSSIDFYINDCTPSEIQSESVSKIKQVLSEVKQRVCGFRTALHAILRSEVAQLSAIL